MQLTKMTENLDREEKLLKSKSHDSLTLSSKHCSQGINGCLVSLTKKSKALTKRFSWVSLVTNEFVIAEDICENTLHLQKKLVVFTACCVASGSVTVLFSFSANYSKPNVTQSCGDGSSCVVNCVSYGGYPRMGIMWHVPGNRMWMVKNSSEMQDPDIMTVNSSSTASFNCSSGELRSIRCSAGDATSDLFSVCEY